MKEREREEKKKRKKKRETDFNIKLLKKIILFKKNDNNVISFGEINKMSNIAAVMIFLFRCCKLATATMAAWLGFQWCDD